MNNVVEYTKDDVGFYPTPPDVAEKMLSQINWKAHTYKSILEPSAGKGNLVDALLRKAYSQYGGRYGNTGMKIDCVEIDPYLRGIIEHEFCGAKLNEIKNRLRTLEDTRHDARDEKTNSELAQLQEEKGILSCSDVHIVADDFLSYRTHKHYDAIIMNPPFANGDEHLIHAIEMQKFGGAVVCLLNAETIKNPYTKTRKLLKKYLEKYSAEVQFIDGAFVHAERATDVEIALITVVVPRKEEKSYIFEGLKKAQERKHETRESTEVTSGDYLERIVEQFNFEVEGTLRLIREYEAVKPYMLTSFEEGCKDAILTLSLAKDKRNYEQLVSVNKYLSIVRLKYWRALFRNKEFTGALTKNLYEKYHNIVESMGDYDFTMYNIRRFQQQIMSELSSGVNDTILALFEKLKGQLALLESGADDSEGTLLSEEREAAFAAEKAEAVKAAKAEIKAKLEKKLAVLQEKVDAAESEKAAAVEAAKAQAANDSKAVFTKELESLRAEADSYRKKAEAAASGGLQRFSAYFELFQNVFSELVSSLDKLRAEGDGNADKLAEGVKGVLDVMKEKISH